MAKEIQDLHGNKFIAKDWKLCLSIPIGKCDKLIFTRDYVSGDSFNLAVKRKPIRHISITLVLIAMYVIS